MQFKNILKLVGAGLTGGYLALKIRRPRKSYGEFLRLYATLSVDVLHQLESCFIESFLPAVSPENRSQFEDLLDAQATFQEKMRFFQQHVDDFEGLVIKAIHRFYGLKKTGAIATSARKKALDFDKETFNVAVKEIYFDLEECFIWAMLANASETTKAELKKFLEDKPALEQSLGFYRSQFDHLGPVVFDAFAKFENRVVKPVTD